METMIQALNEHLQAILGERALDPRLCYTHVYARPPDGRAIVCESSEEAVLTELRERMRSDHGEAVLVDYVHLPAEAGELPERLIAASSVADVRREPSHPSELRSQIIYGDSVIPLKLEGEWYLVRLDDGYLGWIRSWHVVATDRAEIDRFRDRAQHRLSANNAQVLEAPEDDAMPVTDLVIGSPLVESPCGRRGWRHVVLADGKEGFLDGRWIERQPRTTRISRDQLSVTGLRFLGIPYIWGGATPKGFDCSGLVQRIYRLSALVIPRDSDLQSVFGRRRRIGSPEDLRTGDLLFFGRSDDRINHVGMALTDGLFLHSHGQVKVGSVDPGHRLFEAKLTRDWCLTRDPIPAKLAR